MEKSNKRNPVVAGQFYPSSAEELKRQIKSFVGEPTNSRDAIACLLPHAGYMYSGRVAAQTLANINIKDNFILLGPNHTGYGPEFSIMTTGVWQTPLGSVKINSDLARKILAASKYLKEDTLAHAYEHSLEVELPLLQYFKDDFKIVPIILASDNADSLKKIGKEISQAVKDSRLDDSTVIIASSDLTHYEPQGQAQKKDRAAIDAILELDEDKLMNVVKSLNISMCGYAPSICMLVAAKILGAKSASLIKYQTSGDITGDKNSVVGYAGIILY